VTEIQQNRWDQLVRRAANIVGGGSQVNDTLNELFPVIDVERVPGELLLLGGIRIAHGGSSIQSAVGESPKGMIFNPVGSGQIITVTGVVFAQQATATVRMGTQSVPHTSVVSTQILRDTRNLPPDLPIGSIRQMSAVALADANTQWRQLANVPFKIDDQNGLAVLAPGTGLEIGSNGLNATIHFSFWWRERVAEPAELNL